MRARWAAVLLATGLLLTGCGSSGSQGGGAGTTAPTTPSPATSAPTTPASTSTASAEVCADAAALQASVDQLVTITVGPGAVTELQNDLKDVQSSLTTLLDTASTDWQDEIAALRASLTTLQTAVEQLASNPGTSTVAAVRTALQGVRSAARNLFAAVSASCPSLSPSPSS
jgi:ElaB/YqjD/DUF883 family membrane-anchored ribosome-binding protein